MGARISGTAVPPVYPSSLMSAGPPARAFQTWLWITLGAVAIASVVGAVALESWALAHESFTCPGVSWSIRYEGSGSGYLDSNPSTGCLGYPVTEPSGYLITLLIDFENHAVGTTHAITSITVSAPSVLDSVSPTLPVSVPPEGSTNVTLNVTIPTLMGQYVVDGSVTTQ
jgi:hypothetical protein